jgi:PKD repeat protein
MKKHWSVAVSLLLNMLLLNAAQNFTGQTGTIPDDQTWKTFYCFVSGLSQTNLNATYGLERVTLSISHPSDYELEVHLVAPDNTDILLVSYQRYGGTDFTNTSFCNTDIASIETAYPSPFTGNFHPQGDLGLVNNGQNGNGLWKLRIRDNFSGNSGSLQSWSLKFSNSPSLQYTPVASHLPIIKINTYGQDIPDPYKISCWMQTIDNGPGQLNHITDTNYTFQGNIGIEIRGSSSATFPKLGYGFETWDSNNVQVSQSLLGMPAESDWVLLSNYADKTLMHNVLTYNLFTQMGHYAPRTRYCEVFLNGVYQGVYTLIEKIKRSHNRLDIAKLNATDTAGDNLTGGYIVKIDKFTGSGGGGFYSNYPPSNPVGDVIYYQHDYPSDASIAPQQSAYIQKFVDSFETALYGANFRDTANGFRKFAGEKSFIDYMFINEMAKNVDGYRLSTYFYKDKQSKGGKFKAGPVWDYDISWDNANYCEADRDTGWAYNLDYVCSGASVPAHWERMRQDSLFNMHVNCRWKYLRQHVLHLDSLFEWIDSTWAYIDSGQARNFKRWQILGQPTWPEPTPNPATYPEEITRLKTWLTNRLAWLDSQIYNFPVYQLTPSLGSNSTICAGTSLSLTPGIFDSYLWNTGDTSSTKNILQSGTYSVTVSDNFNCSGSATVNVNVLASPQVSLGNDTSFCAGHSVILDAGNAAQYHWSNGAAVQQILVSTAGVYTVTVTGTNSCTASDSIAVIQHPNLYVNIGNDTSICSSATLEISAGSGAVYNWSTGESTQQILVSQSNYYQVTVTDINGCTGTDGVVVFVMPPANSVFSVTAVSSAKFSFTPTATNASAYNWNFGDGDTSSVILPVHTYNTSGNFTVTLTLTDNHGCVSTSTQTIHVVATGLDKVVGTVFSVFPNPVHDELTLVSSEIEMKIIRIVDLTGDLIKELVLHSQNSTISVADIANGIYTLEISVGDETFRQKLVKQ